MIEKAKILELIKDLVKEKEHFIVQLEIDKANTIRLLVDNMKGIQIDECVALSRAIEKGLDREMEDFELLVSSPGLDAPFKVIQQYIKNIGREVKVSLKDKRNFQGKLMEADDTGFGIEENKKVKMAGKKKKQTVIEKNRFLFDDVNEVKIVIKF